MKRHSCSNTYSESAGQIFDEAGQTRAPLYDTWTDYMYQKKVALPLETSGDSDQHVRPRSLMQNIICRHISFTFGHVGGKYYSSRQTPFILICIFAGHTDP